MDALILSFNKEQLDKYHQLIEEIKPHGIEFDFSFEEPLYFIYDFDKTRRKLMLLINEIHRLYKFTDMVGVLYTPISREHLKELIPVYYDVINSISNIKKDLINDIETAHSNFNSNEKMNAKIIATYSDFLPYKAALLKNIKYSEKIHSIDKRFEEVFKDFNNCQEENSKVISILSKIVDEYIDELFQTTLVASDSPRFERFNDKDFFFSIRSFIEKIHIAINTV